MDVGSRLRKNAHFKTTDAHDFVCLVGKNDRRSARLKKAVRFTDFGAPFPPTQWGIEFKGPENFHMGIKELTDNRVEIGLSRVRHLIDP